MRNPARWRTVCLASSAAGAVACVLAFVLPQALASDPVRTGLFAVGLTAAILGGAAAWFAHSSLRAKEALERGEDVVARWHVDAARWEAFVELDGRLNGSGRVLVNDFSPSGSRPGGVDVVVGKDAVEIDGSVHEVPRRGIPEVTHAELVSDVADYIDLSLYFPGGGHGASGVPRGPTRSALRFPVGQHAWRDARQVVAYFNGNREAAPDFFHGRGDGSDPEDLNTCIYCGFQTHKFQSVCPKCGGGMATRRWSRRFGGVLVVAGVFISGVMGWVLYTTVPLLLHPGVRIDGWSFDGGPGAAAGVLAVLAFVMAFGLTALSYGIWQVRTGKRSLRMIYGIAGAWSVFLLIALLI